MKLRPYQQEAVDAVMAFTSRSNDPCCFEAATGAGKSVCVAELARLMSSKGRVLCTAPSKELVEQNHSKYRAFGKASMFSASAGRMSTKQNVVFGTPMTIKNHIKRFTKGNYAAIVIDECHTAMTPTMLYIIKAMQEANPAMAVIGMTATPYRLGTGYIYKVDDKGKTLPEDQARKPFFHKMVYRITAPSLIEQGFLTRPVMDIKEGYDTSSLIMEKGRYTNDSLVAAFEGYGRKTAMIVNEVVSLSSSRKGVMFFGATIQHCQEIASSLPAGTYAIVSGDMKKKDRESAINAFKNQRIKYIINRDVLTTGFDAPHVDVVAILRRTESAALLQQIIGRGLRLSEGKTDVLILDYAENIESHFPDGDIFAPQIQAFKKKEGGANLEVCCPDCNYVNEFAARENPDQLKISSDGYFLDALNHKLELPAHHGRRCQGFTVVDGLHIQCAARWAGKECEACGHENDMTARYCKSCKAEIIDPNEKLVIEYKKLKSSTSAISTDKLISWGACQHQGQKHLTIRIDWTTEYRTFSAYYLPQKKKEWILLCEEIFGKGHIAPTIEMFWHAFTGGYANLPTTITAVKPKGNKFYQVLNYNQPEDEKPC